MMNHGLLAPQFGRSRQFREAELAFAAAFEPPQQAPTVVVKRKRHLEAVVGEPANSEFVGPPAPAVLLPQPSTQADEAETAAQRAPKVFRLDAPAEPEVAAEPTPQAPVAPAVGETPEPVAPVVVRRRRPRDPLKAPTLVQHIVFARPEEPPAAEAAPSAQPSGWLNEYQAVTAALHRLRGEVSKYEAGRGIFDDLSRMLKAAKAVAA